MKFQCQVNIKAPKEKVVSLFDSSENLKEWQDGFLGMTHISGTAGQEGAVSEIRYKMGKGEMLLTETILRNNLPDDFLGRYDHKHTSNTMLNVFVEKDDGSTDYIADVEYTRLSGFMVKLMAFIAPGMFKKQVQRWMNQFRDFVENRVSHPI